MLRPLSLENLKPDLTISTLQALVALIGDGPSTQQNFGTTETVRGADQRILRGRGLALL